jgi:hypothetical protein
MTQRTKEQVKAELERAKRTKEIAVLLQNDWSVRIAANKVAELRVELAAIERTQDDRAG